MLISEKCKNRRENRKQGKKPTEAIAESNSAASGSDTDTERKEMAPSDLAT